MQKERDRGENQRETSDLWATQDAWQAQDRWLDVVCMRIVEYACSQRLKTGRRDERKTTDTQQRHNNKGEETYWSCIF